MPGVQSVIVVTAGTTEYRSIIDAQARKCAEFGYQHVVYDLGGLGIGEPYVVEIEDLKPTVNGDSLPPATFKAELVSRSLVMAVPGEVVMWLDADCIPVREFLPDGDWEAVVTLRAVPEVGLSNNAALDYLNSGAVWFRNSPVGRSLCLDWAELSYAMNTDQGALNEVVAPGYQAVAWNSLRGTVHDGVLVLDAMEWNCWHFPPPANARILHFKGGIRYLAKDYVNR